MNHEQQELCRIASGNARSLEEMMLTPDDVMALDQDSAQDVIERCEQIIRCMRECFVKV